VGSSVKFVASLAVLTSVFSLAAAAQAAPSFTNGGFELNTGAGQVGYNTSVTGWSVSGGYTFLFAPGTGDTTGADGQYGDLSLWGPGNGAANGFGDSPDGGYFIGQDTDFQNAAITQTITGLVAGHTYTVGFDWAGAQQSGFDGPTIEQWQVSLGGQTQSTSVVDLPNHGFSGWMHQTFSFTADNSSDVLSFLGQGTPGNPPFALLDGVTFSAAPEPATWTMMILGMGGMGAVVRRRRSLAVA
jgi:hypothetical protein